MNEYRDELDAARHRIETLESEIFERDAALHAREVKIRELTARLGRLAEVPEASAQGEMSQRPKMLIYWALGAAATLAITLPVIASMARHDSVPDLCPSVVVSTPGVTMPTFQAPSVPPPVFNPTALYVEPAGSEGRVVEAGREFNRSEAISALNKAAMGAKECKRPDGPTGRGRVSVTFAPTGRVTAAVVDGAPFAGTSTGGCIAAAFRKATVPPFDGSAVTVHKSFAIDGAAELLH